MGTFFYLVIWSSVLPFVELVTWPTSGCLMEYDSLLCLVNVYCVNYYDLRDESFRIDHYFGLNIRESHYDYYRHCIFEEEYEDGRIREKENEVRYAKANIYYKNMDIFDEIPKITNGDGSSIINLNLVDNEYSSVPNLYRMENLQYLNLSHNSLITAKLYNTNYLKSLNVLDLSYNKINSFNIKGEYKYTNLTKIILSHNYLTELTGAILEDFKKLTTLDLSYNKINQIQMSTFEGIKYLTCLDLSNNKITEINSSLFRFTDLKILDLSHNDIQNIQTSDFVPLKQLEILNLSYNSIKSMEKTFINGMKNLNNFNLRNNVLEVIDDFLFLNSTYLKTVDLAHNKLKKIPKNLFKNKNISLFYIDGNSLEGTLVRGMFEGLSLVSDMDLSYQLYFFKLYYNKLITSIDNYAFFGLEKLESLLLNNNNIASLSKNCFKSLHNLYKLDLSNNKIEAINFDTEELFSLRMLLLSNNSLRYIIPEYFNHLGVLRYLNLANNNITQLSPKAFNTLQELIHLEIWNNSISGAVNESTFESLSSLPSLDVSNTQLTSIKNNSFIGMTRLKFLNLSHSKIAEIEYNSFFQANAIELIDLSYNGIVSFSLNPLHLLNLTKLFLNNNKLKSINSYCFKGLSHLQIVNFARNNIEVIHNDALNDQKYLQHLDLSFNSKMKFNMSLIERSKELSSLTLSGIQYGIEFSETISTPLKLLDISNCDISNITSINLKALSSLENIFLRNNQIQHITESSFNKVNNLKVIDLSFNKINTIQPGVFRDNPSLLSLNISHNVLHTLSYGTFRNLYNLQVLDISYNYIRDLKSERFFELHSLKQLIVDSNKIEIFDAVDFNGTNLIKLSIGDNPLPCELVIQYLNKTDLTFTITALNNIENNQENHYGITCNKRHIDNRSISDKDYISSENAKILNDIREIIGKLATDINTQEHVTSSNDAEYWHHITNHIDQLNSKYDEKLSSLANFSITTAKETNYTNVLLQKILNVVMVANTLNRQTTPIPFTKDNVTFDNLIQYINKMKQDVEDIIASEKQGILNDLETKLSVINSHVASMSSTNSPVTEKLENRDQQGNQAQSTFMATCVALILVMTVCYVLLELYKSKLCMRRRRSYSTRELPGSMESPNL